MTSYLRSLRQAVVRTTLTATTAVLLVEVTTHLPSQGRASETYHHFVDQTVTPLLRGYASPETAHNLALYFARKGLAPIYRPSAKEQQTDLSTRVFGISFSNPIGLAAGFDKNGTSILGLQNMGFGFIEIGSVTPQPQPGNPKPRMFRLLPDNAIINRYGFNSEGMQVVKTNLAEYRESLLEPVETKNDNESTQPLHRIIQTNKVSQTSEADDYRQGIRMLGPYADYIVINVSSPNTPGLRDSQAPSTLQELIRACLYERDQVSLSLLSANNNNNTKIPLLVKLAPDLSNDELREIAAAVLECELDGLIVCNTTNTRPAQLMGASKEEPGGLSGAPLRDRSTECIKLLYQYTEGKIPIIGVGGISSAEDVLEKLKAGASLVQVYSVLAFEGPGVVTTMRHELASLLKNGGFRSVQDAVGYSHEELYWKRKEVEREAAQRTEHEPMVVEDLNEPEDSLEANSDEAESSTRESDEPVLTEDAD
ncbi:dihydroorotate dehydrogenase-like protein [Fragilaria crotonensis]|nr:dihydroorotate dehydrogenase-like protein [Fragilaria crotonensis]